MRILFNVFNITMKLCSSISQNDIDEIIKQAVNPCLVVCYADWCESCRLLDPVLEQLQHKFGSQIDFYACNLDQNERVALQYNVNAIPTVLFFLWGQLTGEPIVWAHWYEQYADRCTSLLSFGRSFVPEASIVELLWINQLDALLAQRSEGLFLLTVNAQWCSPCRNYKPSLEFFQKEFSHVVQVIQVDADCLENIQICSRFRVFSLPYSCILQNGKVLEERIGPKSSDELWVLIKKYC